MNTDQIKNTAIKTGENIGSVISNTITGTTNLANAAVIKGEELTSNTIDGTTNLANTAVTKGLKLTDDTLTKSLETAQIIQTAVNNTVQTSVNTGAEGIQSASNIAIQGSKSAEAIAEKGLNLAVETSSTTSDIAKTGLQETKNIAQTGLIQLGKVTTTSITAAGTTLQALFSVTNNAASRALASSKARNVSDDITSDGLVYENLKKRILSDFTMKMGKFIKDFKEMVSNQQILLSSILNVYKLKNCQKGWTGYTCDSEISKKIVEFNKNLKIIYRESESNITLLKSIITEAHSNVFNINTINTTPEKYAEELGNKILELSTKASEIFTFTLEKFRTFADSINRDNVTELKNDNVDSVTGGRKKRKTHHKKSRKSRKSIKNCKNRKH